MKLRTPTLDLIATEYAEAVASGEFERAEGWLAVAVFAAQRQRDRERTGDPVLAPNRPMIGREARSHVSG